MCVCMSACMRKVAAIFLKLLKTTNSQRIHVVQSFMLL